MPVSPFTYLYLILMISNSIFCVMAALRRDEEKFAIFILSTMLFLIGYLCNRYVVRHVVY